MIQINLDGRLGKDAELKQSKNGRKYVSFSFANSIFINKEEKTNWYNVISFNQTFIDQCEKLTKGKYLFISGNYSDEAIAKNGQIFINRNILADSFSYLSGNRTDNGENNQNRSHSSESDVDITTNYQKPVDNSNSIQQSKLVNSNIETKATIEEQTSQSTQINDDDFDGDDDLPF